jgi:pyruvate dehydrogenase E2 component (dihydrolipoamide acetyltransferase)
MTELTDLVARVRAGSMRGSEMSDPTLTVSNLGERGVGSVLGVM